jgi:tripartite-type tricarboxylate transporter receptor subunit TctC
MTRPSFQDSCRRLFVAAAAAVSLCNLSNGFAQDGSNYPSRPIRFYVCCAPGGSADIVSRLIGQKLSERVTQPVIVENRVGGSGLLASDLVAKAPPDGYQMVLLSGGHPVSAALMKHIPFDPVDGFGMVTLVTTYPFMLAVAQASPIKSFPDFIARAKAEPGKLTAAIGALGTMHHLVAERVNIEAGIDTLIVPLKGAGASVVELLGGRIDVMYETATATLSHMKAGKIRPLALTAPARYSLTPDVPPMTETIPGLEATSWLGLAVAPKTPRPVVGRLNREVRAILEMADVRRRLADLGGTATPSSPEEMRERIVREVAQWKQVVAVKGIQQQ